MQHKMSGNTLRFVFAGRSTFTLKSVKTGTRFTYRVKSNEDGACFFVSILNGPDNERNYTYMGTIFNDNRSRLVPTKNSRVSNDAISFKAINFFLTHPTHPGLEFYHEGRCGKCGRKLTVPESIESGLGPICQKN